MIPATPTSAILNTLLIIVSKFSLYPASISADTGNFTLSVMVLTILKFASKSINSPSAYPNELAIPQLVVPIALKPAFSKVKADKRSQALPKNNISLRSVEIIEFLNYRHFTSSLWLM